MEEFVGPRPLQVAQGCSGRDVNGARPAAPRKAPGATDHHTICALLESECAEGKKEDAYLRAKWSALPEENGAEISWS